MQESIEELKNVVDKLLRMHIGGYTPGRVQYTRVAVLPEIDGYATPTHIQQRAIAEEGAALRNSISLLGHYIDGFTVQKTQAAAAFAVPRTYYSPEIKEIDPVSVVVNDTVTLNKWHAFITGLDRLTNLSPLPKFLDLTLTSEARDLATSLERACKNNPVSFYMGKPQILTILGTRLRCILYSAPLKLPAKSHNYIQTLGQAVIGNVNARKQREVKARPNFTALANVITCNTFSRIVLSIYEASSKPAPGMHFWRTRASFTEFLQEVLNILNDAVITNNTLQEALDVVQGMLFNRDKYQTFATICGIKAEKVGSISAVNKHSADLKRAFNWILTYQLLDAYFWQQCSINRHVFDQAPDISWYDWMMFVSAVVCIDEEVVRYLDREKDTFDTKHHIYKTEEQERCIRILGSLLEAYAKMDNDIHDIAAFQTRLAVYTNVRITNAVLHTLQVGAVSRDEPDTLHDLLSTVPLDGRAHKLSDYLLEKLLYFEAKIANLEEHGVRHSDTTYADSLRYLETQQKEIITAAQDDLLLKSGSYL